jgi:hypothetical protein
MGLLDDAIREHLELKRLHGADPGEVARKEHEALGREALEFAPPDGSAADHSVADGKAANAGATPQSASERDLSHVGQETVELDMRTVMDDGGEHAAHPASSGAPAEE